MEAKYGSSPALRAGALLVGAVLFVLAFGVFIGSCSSLNRTEPGEVNLIRNGGWFDDRSIREVRSPNSGYAVSGLFSEVRRYIAGDQQRYYTVASDPSLDSKGGTSFIEVPTRDGVEVAIDAQVLFRTAFTTKDGHLTDESEALLREFDERFGNRTFTPREGDAKKVWEGGAGWNAFLDAIFRPVVENAFREEIGSVNCAELVSSCALVQSSGKVDLAALAEADNRASFNRIQGAVQDQIEQGVGRALGGEFLVGYRVQLTKVSLPPDVQHAINRAQASFAQIAEARAQNVQSKFEAARNRRLAEAYASSPGLALIKAAEELSGNSKATVILGTPGAGFNIGK